MAQLNITLNQEEILQLLCKSRDDAFKLLLQESLNSILRAESQEQLKAMPYERTGQRTDSRNGVRERELTTRIGTIKLTVPRHRNVPFKTMIFENYSRSEAALVASMAEMVVNGVSTRKVSKVVETLCGTSVSKSTVSDVCKDLDGTVKEFKERPLTGRYPFISVDATYFKVREHGRVISKAMMIAYATRDDGIKDVIGFEVYKNESKETWREFMAGLKKRGLSNVMLITSDAHEGILYAIRKEFPDVPWQRCQVHFSRNIVDKAPKKYQVGLQAELHEMFRSYTLKAARIKRDQILEDYGDVAEDAMRCLEEGFEHSMTVMTIPDIYRLYFRSTNSIERLNRELKRRSNVIGIFSNVKSLTRLMGMVLFEQNELRQRKRPLYSRQTFEKLENTGIKHKLVLIAHEQEKMLAA